MKKILLFASFLFVTASTALFAQHPVNLLTSNITSSSADLSWDASVCMGNVNLSYRIVGASWNPVINNVTSPYSLTGLTPGQLYEWRVKCVGTPGWASPVQFITPAPGPIFSSVVITNPIDCFGGTATITINVNQTTPATVRTLQSWSPHPQQGIGSHLKCSHRQVVKEARQ